MDVHATREGHVVPLQLQSDGFVSQLATLVDQSVLGTLLAELYMCIVDRLYNRVPNHYLV